MDFSVKYYFLLCQCQCDIYLTNEICYIWILHIYTDVKGKMYEF